MLVKPILPRYHIDLENTDLTHQAKPKPKRIGHHQKRKYSVLKDIARNQKQFKNPLVRTWFKCNGSVSVSTANHNFSFLSTNRCIFAI